MSHLDDLDEYEAELELRLKREYQAVFGLFRYCVLTPDATYLCNKLERTYAPQPAYPFIRLKLEDGSDYGYTGTVQFSEQIVDLSTGTVTLRARFPNPRGVLLPGMFVQALFTQAVDSNVFLVPQAALQRDIGGTAFVWVAGAGHKAERRPVTATRTYGANWVVTAGLNPGDKVITQGISNLKSGAPIKPVPASAPQKVAPGKSGAGKPGGSAPGGRRGAGGG
jgi:membrane fusion protein (multidrug efflux system)